MPATLKYLIVDDEEISRLTLEAYASGFPFLHQIASCSNALEALELIHRFQPEIVFADIEMPGMTGLELIKALAGSVPAPVFVTSHPEFAIEGFELEVFDYLVKPINPERFYRCVDRLRDFFELKDKAFSFEQATEANTITIKEGYDRYKIHLNDILFLEAMKDYTKIVTMSHQYLVLATLASMHEKLPAADFMRIHRSYIVNCNKITAAKGNKILVPAHELPVGKMYKKVVDEML